MARKTWRELLDSEGCLVLPGAHDALSARLIERAGFSAYIVGGYPLVGARYGVPDIGLAGLGEMSDGVRDIMRGSSLPVMIDGDHGYGDVKNVTNTVRTYERLGASAIFLEDQVMPKRCGHMAGKDVVEPEVMEKKLRAAAAARETDLFIVARTDARAIHGLDDALRRCERYIAAGADGVFVEAPETVEELETIVKAFDVPQMCNMLVNGRTPILSNRELADMGYAMVIHGINLVMRAARAFQDSLAAIRDDAPEPAEYYAGFEEFKQIMGFDDWAAVEEEFG
jgi:2-methylisocitrate lyase-like PEP mutase family enzyme